MHISPQTFTPYYVQQCVDCPEIYESDPESDLVCDLWTELENAQQKQTAATGSSDHQNNDIISTIANLAPVSCLYQDHLTSSDNLCSLWCQLQAFEVINKY